jgi:hypothetical protein
MSRVRTLVACLAAVVSVAACGGTEALTAPDAARFNAGMLGSGNATSGPTIGSGGRVGEDGGQVGSGNDVSSDGGYLGSGGGVDGGGSNGGGTLGSGTL